MGSRRPGFSRHGGRHQLARTTTGSAAIRLAWTFPLLLPVLLAAVAAPAAEPDAGLPRVRRLVAEHAPVRVVVYGDSISEVKKSWSGGASAPGAEQQLPAGGGSVAPSSRSTDRTPGPRAARAPAELGVCTPDLQPPGGRRTSALRAHPRLAASRWHMGSAPARPGRSPDKEKLRPVQRG